MYNTSRCSGGFRIRAILDRNKIISITRPPRQLQTWEYYRQNRTIKLHFMRCQRRVLEYFPKMWDFILPQTGLLRSTVRPSDLGPGGGSYNEPISCLQHVCVGGMECGLVVARVSWGCAKSVVNLANFSPCPC